VITFSLLGSISIAFAYIFLSLNLIKDQSKIFYSLLLFGNISFIIYSIFSLDLPVLILNIGFSFFSIMAIMGKDLKISWINFKLFLISLLITILLSLYLNSRSEHNLMITVGWFCTAASFGIYLLYSQKKTSLFNYFLVNMITNILFCFYLYFNKNYPYMVLQFFLFSFSLYGVIRLIIHNKKLEKSKIKS